MQAYPKAVDDVFRYMALVASYEGLAALTAVVLVSYLFTYLRPLEGRQRKQDRLKKALRTALTPIAVPGRLVEKLAVRSSACSSHDDHRPQVASVVPSAVLLDLARPLVF